MYELDYWYQPLAQFTYSSRSFPLTAHEAYIIHCLYYQYKLNEEDCVVKDNLVTKIDKILADEKNKQIKNDNEKKPKYFMKLSTRSPKDNCWDYRD